jgi:hypothetical protein
VLRARQWSKLAWGSEDQEHAISEQSNRANAVIGIDIGENSFHVVGHDQHGAIDPKQMGDNPCIRGLRALVVMVVGMVAEEMAGKCQLRPAARLGMLNDAHIVGAGLDSQRLEESDVGWASNLDDQW